MRRTYLSPRMICCCTILLVSAVSVSAGEAKKDASEMTISNGKQVTLEYTMKLDDQSVVDTSVGGEPLKLTQGSHQIIPGIEKELEGMMVGEKKKFTVAPTEGYGIVDPKAFQEVDKRWLSPDSLVVGAPLEGKIADGRKVFPRISEVKADTVVLDFNHPLAGKTLHFDIEILDIAQAPSK